VGLPATGYFAPTSRHGSPDELRAFVRCLPPGRRRHHPRLGSAHFPRDAWALARYDGPRSTNTRTRGWRAQGLGTHIFNYGRNEVKSFLLSSAAYWLSEFHFDGLRVDAVASMLYLDYSRKAGEWLPNRYGGREKHRASSSCAN